MLFVVVVYMKVVFCYNLNGSRPQPLILSGIKHFQGHSTRSFVGSVGCSAAQISSSSRSKEELVLQRSLKRQTLLNNSAPNITAHLSGEPRLPRERGTGVAGGLSRSPESCLGVFFWEESSLLTATLFPYFQQLFCVLIQSFLDYALTSAST